MNSHLGSRQTTLIQLGGLFTKIEKEPVEMIKESRGNQSGITVDNGGVNMIKIFYIQV